MEAKVLVPPSPKDPKSSLQELQEERTAVLQTALARGREQCMKILGDLLVVCEADSTPISVFVNLLVV